MCSWVPIPHDLKVFDYLQKANNFIQTMPKLYGSSPPSNNLFLTRNSNYINLIFHIKFYTKQDTRRFRHRSVKKHLFPNNIKSIALVILKKFSVFSVLFGRHP